MPGYTCKAVVAIAHELKNNDYMLYSFCLDRSATLLRTCCWDCHISQAKHINNFVLSTVQNHDGIPPEREVHQLGGAVDG